MDALVTQIIEGLKPTVKQAIIEILIPAQATQPEVDICNIHRASEITGLAVPTLYIKFGKGQLPKSVAWKRGGRLYFSISGLIDWVKAGNE